MVDIANHIFLERFICLDNDGHGISSSTYFPRASCKIFLCVSVLKLCSTWLFFIITFYFNLMVFIYFLLLDGIRRNMVDNLKKNINRGMGLPMSSSYDSDFENFQLSSDIAVPLLTHHPKFHGFNMEKLCCIHNCLWFLLEPLLKPENNFRYGNYWELIRQMKLCTNGFDPEDSSANQKLWAICDVIKYIITKERTSFEEIYSPFPCLLPNLQYR